MQQTGKSDSFPRGETCDITARRAATIGTFEGVHRGHLCVLHTLRNAAAERGMRPMAITFGDHPLSVIAPDRAPGALMSTRRKLALLRREGTTPHLLNFTPSTARLSTAEWMRHLHEIYNVDCIVIGFDNTFGHDGRSLSPDDYIRLGKEMEIEIIIAPKVAGISSSAIRHDIEAGKIEDANKMLAYPYTLDGIVIKGDQIGRTIGFPTANLQLLPPTDRVLPPYGAYASETLLPDGRLKQSVTNIGIRPSIEKGKTELRIETYILDFDEDIYGKEIEVRLLKFLRPEKKFDSLEALKKQLEEDVSEH